MYFTDRGIEELEKRRGDEEVTLAWIADRLQEFVDLNPEFEIPVERLTEFLAWFDHEIGMRPVWLCPLRLRHRERQRDRHRQHRSLHSRKGCGPF